MISRHIEIAPENDNYGRLARYIARLDEYADEQEPPLMTWCVGCVGGEDYRDGIAEAQDTQALNTRSKANPTYHLVISFRPEDEEKLTPEIFREIERRFADALGLSEHQRHCAVHNDTKNIHLQIAYNLIHPITRNRNFYSHDHAKRDQLCRQLEKEYGLTVDNGMEAKKQEKGNEKAKAIELQQGIQSFDSYAKQFKEQIGHALDAAENWQDIHNELAKYGLIIKPQNNGLAIKNKHANHGMKASELDRRLSKKSLEKRLGAYTGPEANQIKEVSIYEGKPIHRSPAQEALWAAYKHETAARAEAIENEKKPQKETITAIKEKWAIERAKIQKMSVHRRNRQHLIQIAKKREAAELATFKAEAQKRQDNLFSRAVKYSWNEFLRERAEAGDETALAVLRSKSKREALEKKEQQTEQQEEVTPPEQSQAKARPDFAALADLKAQIAEQQTQILENEALTGKGKRQLQAFLRMDELMQEEKIRGSSALEGITRKIDNTGTIIFKLPSGGKIMDTGAEVIFSGSDPAAHTIAHLYAKKKWGKRIKIEKNRISFDKSKPHERGERPQPSQRKPQDASLSGPTTKGAEKPDKEREAAQTHRPRKWKGLSR